MKNRLITLLNILLTVFVFPSHATTYYLKTAGSINNVNSWSTTMDGTGPSPSGNFLGNHEFIICNRTSVNTGGTLLMQCSSGATLTIGDGTNTIQVIMNAGDYVEEATVNVASNATLTLNTDPAAIFSPISSLVCGINTLASNSTVEYNSYQANVAVPYSNPPLYGNLVLSDDAYLAGHIQTASLSVAPTKTLDLSSFSVTIYGQISNTGSLTAPTGTIFFNIITQTGNCGTLYLDGPVNTLRLNSLTSTYITLGNNFTVTGTNGGFINNANSGLMDLNGNILRVANSITMPSNTSSMWRADANSGIIFEGTGAFVGSNNIRFNTSFNTIKLLQLNRSSAVLSLQNALNITDSVSVLAGTFNSNGNLTLKSTAALTARVGRISGTFNGNVVKETIIPGNKTGWANLGSPGISGQTFASWDTYFSSSQTNGIPMVCTACSYTPGQGGMNWFKSIQGWNESNCAYDTTLSQSSSLTTGKGFWVYVGDGQVNTNNLLLRNTGNIVTGTQAVTLTAAGSCTDVGANLIANPYASPISWTSFRSANGNPAALTNGYYSWNADNSSHSGWVGGATFNGGTDAIQAGQGFYVVTSASMTLNFTEACKTVSNTSANPLLRPASNYGQIFRLKIKSPNSGENDEAVFRLHPSATWANDQEWDLGKIFVSPGYAGYPGSYSKYTTISSQDPQGIEYAINSFPPQTNSIVIPITVRVSSAGSYTIHPQDFEQLTYCAVLYDKVTNSFHDLKNGSDYVFAINDSTMFPRFELRLCQSKQEDVTSISENSLNNQVLISKDVNGAYVKTNFDHSTKAVISVYNLIGQKLCEDIAVEGTETTTRLNLGAANQIVFVKVTTATETYTKKFLVQ